METKPTKEKTMLEKAKEIKKPLNFEFHIDHEFMELALGWVNDEVRISDIAKVTGLKGTGHQTYAKIAKALKIYIKTLPIIPKTYGRTHKKIYR